MGLMKSRGLVLDQSPSMELENLEMLLAGLESDDADLRRMAARDLIGFPQATRPLGEQLEVEDDPQALDSILHTLGCMGSTEAVEFILPCLRSSDPFKRNQAIEVLKGLPDQVAPFIEDLLHDPDPDVRIFTVNVLESLKHPHVVSWLIDVIQLDDHINVCATALDLLAEVGDETCLPALYEAGKRFPEEPYFEFTIHMAIERILESTGSAE